MKQPQYISVSRRTDIPRFYHRAFFSAWQEGAITYDGGYGRTYTVSLQRADVLGYIFWSKDFSLFIKDARFKELVAANNAVFHFTINHCLALEPRLAPLEKRLDTMARLCDLVGSERVLWRFDPLCKYLRDSDGLRDNVAAFFILLPFMEKIGISRCYFSFMAPYAKLKQRDIFFLNFAPQERIAIAKKMQLAAKEAGITLYNCSNGELTENVPEIHAAHCVDNDLLEQTDRFNRHLRLKPKPTRKHCGCHESRDIGSYLQRCPHGCLYCYATPCNEQG